MRGARETELLVDRGVSPYPSGRRIIIRWPDGAAPRWDKCEWDWSYSPEIAERAIREGAVTKGSTTAQALFNYERTGYTGPICSRRDLPPTLVLRGWTRDGEGYFALRVYHHSRYGRREASHADTDSDTGIFPLSVGATHSGETVEMSCVVPLIVFPAHATRVCDGRGLVTPPRPDRATRPPRRIQNGTVTGARDA